MFTKKTKKYLATILGISGLLLLTILPNISFAQTPPAVQEAASKNKWCFTYGMPGKTECFESKAACKTASAGAAGAITSQCADITKGSWWDPLITGFLTSLDIILFKVTNLLMGLLTALCLGILWLVTQIFGFSIVLSIRSFKSLAELGGINLIWSLGRDLANIFFIFILMYYAIATIVQKVSGDVKRIVVKVLIVALFINFSILIPKVVIDFSNSLAVVFYNSLGSTSTTMSGVPDIQGTVMKAFFPNGSWSNLIQKAALPSGMSLENLGQMGNMTSAFKQLALCILIILLCYVLLVASYLFIVRTVSLLIIIATSSFVFFSQIIPKDFILPNYWDRWWSALIRESIFAPAFLFLFYMVLKIARNKPTDWSSLLPPVSTKPITTIADGISLLAQAGGAGVASAPAVDGIQSAINNIIWFILICGLTIAAVMVAKSMSSFSQGVAKKIGDYGGRYARKAATNWAGRSTVGRLGNKIANSNWMQNQLAQTPMLGGLFKSGVDKMAGVGGRQKDLDYYSKQNAALGSTSLKLSHLAGLNADQRQHVYENMSAADRAEIHKEAEKNVATNPGQKMLVDRLRTNASGRTTGKKIEKELQVEQFGKLDTAEKRAKYLADANVSEDNYAKLYKDLKPDDRVELEKELEKIKASGSAEQIARVGNIETKIKEVRGKLNDSEKTSMKNAESKYERVSAAHGLVSDLSLEASNSAKRTSTLLDVNKIQNTISKLNNTEISNFMEEHGEVLNNPAITGVLNRDQLGAVLSNNNIDTNIKKAITDKIESDYRTAHNSYFLAMDKYRTEEDQWNTKYATDPATAGPKPVKPEAPVASGSAATAEIDRKYIWLQTRKGTL